LVRHTSQLPSPVVTLVFYIFAATLVVVVISLALGASPGELANTLRAWSFWLIMAIFGILILIGQSQRLTIVMVLTVGIVFTLASTFKPLGNLLNQSYDVNLLSAGVTIMALSVALVALLRMRTSEAAAKDAKQITKLSMYSGRKEQALTSVRSLKQFLMWRKRMTSTNDLRARVFISCGQQKDSEEVDIAKEIERELLEMGYDPYVAVAEHSLKGLKENLFRRLTESEYFLFIDFKRERLFKNNDADFKDTGQHRGSLFSNQELAIASYLGIEALAYQEKGVREQDGILRCIHANCIPFADRHLLPKAVATDVRKNWKHNWRRELLLTREDKKQFVKVDYVAKQPAPSRFYHVKVTNLHKSQTATDCAVYLEKIEDLSHKQSRSPSLVELKWMGVTTPKASIPAGQSRLFDAFHIQEQLPQTIFLGVNPFIVDSSVYYQEYTLQGANDYKLTFVVFSHDFAPSKRSFRLHVGSNLEDIEMEIVD